MKKLLLSLSLLFSLNSTGNPADCKDNELKCLVAKVVLHSEPFYYGTAILFKVTKDRFYFVTNSHVLPSRDRLHNLRMKTDLVGNLLLEVNVEGTYPGKDLAVLSINRHMTDDDSTEQLKKLTEQFFIANLRPNEKFKMGLLGYSGQESETKSNHLAWTNQLSSESKPDLTRQFSAPTPLTVLKACPAPFLLSCYRLPLLSFGFSGGALVAKVSSGRIGIAGIVSHFAPLLGLTYIIPIQEALEAANKIVRLRETSSNSVVINIDDTQTFRMKKRDQLEILKGPLKGKLVVGRSIGSPGGDEGSGGGDEGSGGGDEGSGGGDEGSGGGTEGMRSPRYGEEFRIHRSPYSIVTLEVNHVLLQKEAKDPSFWAFPDSFISRIFQSVRPLKGINDWLRFRPGVTLIDRGAKTTIQRMNDQTIGNLGAFVKEYLQSESLKFSSECSKLIPPSSLRMVSEEPYGYSSTVEIRHFQHSPIIEAKSEETEFFERLKWKEFEIHSFLIRDLKPAFTSLYFLSYGDAGRYVRPHNVEITDKQITMQHPYFGKTRIEPQGEWVQTGDRHFRLEGFAKLATERPVVVAGKRYKPNVNQAIVMTLQYDPIEGFWEYKALLSLATDASLRPDVVINRDGLSVITFSARMKP